MTGAMGSRERLAFGLVANERAAAAARHRIVAAAAPCVGEQDGRTLGLLVSELVTNAVVHGGGRRELEVEADICESSVRVQVRDAGPGFVPRPRALEPDEVGGWGLFLVERLAGRWGVSCGGGTTVWFELDCDPARAA